MYYISGNEKVRMQFLTLDVFDSKYLVIAALVILALLLIYNRLKKNTKKDHSNE